MERSLSAVSEANQTLKRFRDEPCGAVREADERPALRCPWCDAGRLLRPKEKDCGANARDSGVLCTSGDLCRSGEVIERDCSMAFSGISGANLCRRFFAAVDAHVKSCNRNCSEGVKKKWSHCPWSVVAEQSPLFALTSNDFVLSRSMKSVTEDILDDEEGDADAVDCRTVSCAYNGRSDNSTSAVASKESPPVFYFLLCDDCGMSLFDKVHPAVLAAVERILSRDNATPTAVIRDFDGCEYHISVEWSRTRDKSDNNDQNDENGKSDKNDRAAADQSASVHIALRHTTPFRELNAHNNFDEVVERLFPQPVRKFLQPAAHKRRDGAFVAEVRIPPTATKETQRDAIRAAAQLRTWSFVPVFSHQCALYLEKPEAVKPVVLHYHAKEEMILYAHKGSFIVALALRVPSRDEAVCARHYLQTFADAKRLQREVSAAPAFAFEQGKAPEAIARDVPIAFANDPNVFWCSFQLFRRQMEPVEHLTETVTQLVNFRSLLFYHIHTGRSFMHSTMRKRVETSLQVLNRAKTKTTGKAKITLD